MDLGSKLTALSLFVRDRVAQAAADSLVTHLGIGPFGVATNVLRLAAVLQAATVVTKALTGSLHLGAVFDLAMVAIFCWVCVLWSNLTAAAARRPPRPGAATASALRREDYLPLIVMIVAFLAWDLWDLIGGASFTDTLTTASDLIQGAGFLLGSTLWRSLPRSERRSPVAAPSVT